LFIVTHAAALAFLCRRLVQFGLVHGIIRRLRKYPVRTGVTLGPAISEDPRLARCGVEALLFFTKSFGLKLAQPNTSYVFSVVDVWLPFRMLNGRRCYDDIGLVTGMCGHDLDQLFEKEENIVTILK
jgi:hypothetical protein